MIQRSLALCAFIILAGGCADNDKPAPTGTGVSIVRPTGELHPWDLSSIVPVDSVRSMPKGTQVFLRTEYADGELADLEMTFIRVVDDFMPPMPVYMVEASDPVLIQLGGIAKGMSGSPLFTEQGTWGAIAFGFEGQDNPPYYFFATPIEWVIGTQGATPLAKAAGHWEGNRITPLVIPWLSTGLHFTHRTNELGITEFASAGRTQQHQESFDAGRPLAVSFLLGEVTLAGLGTVSYADGDRIYGFGHPMFGSGPVALPIIEAQVLAPMSNLSAPFKFATFNPTVRGTLLEDRLPGVRGRLDEGPALAPIRSMYRFPSGRALEFTHRLATGGLGPSVMAQGVVTAFFDPLLNRVENEPNHSLRVRTRMSFVGTDSTLARSRLYALPEGSLKSAIMRAGADLWDILAQLGSRSDYAIQPREAEVDIEIVPESRFARVMAVEADTVAHAGSTLTVTTPLRVGRLRDQTAELALNLPDTLPPGVYQIEVGSLATLGDDGDPYGGDPYRGDPFGPSFGFGGDEPLADFFVRVNGDDENVVLKARLTFFMPLENGPYPEMPPETVSAQEDVDLLLEGTQRLQIQVVAE
jgi:hypothetical protein